MAGEEVLDAGRRHVERRQLALRTRHSIDGAWLPPPSPPEADVLAGLVRRAGGRAGLTRRGRLLFNQVAVPLADPQPVTPWASS